VLLRSLRAALAVASPVELLITTLGSEVSAAASSPALLALRRVSTGSAVLAGDAASFARMFTRMSLDHYTFT
jgi:hypothetical protein